MNLSDGKSASTSGTWKAVDVVPDQFPAGLRVLVVDDDPTCLMILQKMLLACLYKVTKCNRAEIALSLLRREKNGFDVVISDVHMPDMDGFKLLEHIGLEMDLPIIMMSADDGKDVVMKGVTHGACDYLIKPVRIEALKNIWQHVVRKKKKNEWKEQSGSVEDGDRDVKVCGDDVDYASSANEGSLKGSKKRKDEDDDVEERDDTSTSKKPRVVWSVELHQQFVAAVHQLGIDKAVPKRILEMMNVPGLTRENVASHLQKYRLYLRRVSGVSSQHQNGLGNAYMASQETSYGAISSFNTIDFQALVASGQLSAQSLVAFQAATTHGRSSVKSGPSIPFVDQRNIFSFENPNNNNSKHVNLLHGIPTSMEAKSIPNFHASSQSFTSVNMQGNTRGSQGLNQIAHLPVTGSVPNQSNGIGGAVLPRNIGNGRGMIVNFSEFPSNTFPLGSTPQMQNLSPKGMFQDGINTDIKGQNGNFLSYDIFNEMHKQKPQDWELQNVVVPNFDASHHASSEQGNLDILPSVRVPQQGFSSSQSNVQNQNNRIPNMGQHHNPFLMENPVKIKTENIVEPIFDISVFEEHYGQEDLMSELLKQQEVIGSVETEFDFDGYSIDNIPV